MKRADKGSRVRLASLLGACALWLSICVSAAAQVAGEPGEAARGAAGEVTRGATATSGESDALGTGRPQVRLKDIARIDGVRNNQLIGLGLVVGLDGTGDGRGSVANVQMAANMLQKFGISVSADTLRVKNVAAVMVTATLPPFVRQGDQIDVTLSSLGDAKSLQGGMLLQTPLQAANGRIYAVAQGPVSIGGFNAQGGGASVQKNHATVGRIPGGAIVEDEVPTSIGKNGSLTLVLSRPDFTTASRVASVINKVFVAGTAKTVDAAAVQVQVPTAFADNWIEFIATLEELPVTPDAVAKVIVNERTGTVVMGQDVRIAQVAVAHGNLQVKITPTVAVSQPQPLSGGKTVVDRSAKVEVSEQRARLMVVPGGASVADLVAGLNAIGATPRDLIAILQAIKAAGALYGELEIM